MGTQSTIIIGRYRNPYLLPFNNYVTKHNKKLESLITRAKNTSIFEAMEEPPVPPEDIEKERDIQAHINNLTTYTKYTTSFFT